MCLKESLLYIATTLQKQLFREEMKSTAPWINVFEAVALRELNYSYAAASQTAARLSSFE